MTLDVGQGRSWLPALVGSLTYKPGWTFKLGGPLGRSLCVFATTPDSNDPARTRTTQHMFPIPVLADEAAAVRWVFDRRLDCELHEAGEFFRVAGYRPYLPNHQDEGSPYVLVEREYP